MRLEIPSDENDAEAEERYEAAAMTEQQPATPTQLDEYWSDCCAHADSEHETTRRCLYCSCTKAARAPTPLDVERLAAAIYNCDLVEPVTFHVQTVDHEAARIATEYARLQPPAEPTDDDR